MHSHQAHMCCVLCFYFKARTRRRIIKLTCQGHARTRALFQFLAVDILIICRHRNKQACGHDQCQVYGVHYSVVRMWMDCLCYSSTCFGPAFVPLGVNPDYNSSLIVEGGVPLGYEEEQSIKLYSQKFGGYAVNRVFTTRLVKVIEGYSTPKKEQKNEGPRLTEHLQIS